jgi:molecular chaperone IbpA
VTRDDSTAVAYPPYNIEKTGEGAYWSTMAVAEFSVVECDITIQEKRAWQSGKGQKEDEDGRGHLHWVIARRSFEWRFSFADQM